MNTKLGSVVISDELPCISLLVLCLCEVRIAL